MHVFVRRLCVVALAFVVSLAALPPKAAVAQSTGLGLDGYTRLLWRNVNGNMAVWKLDGNLNVVAIAGYGPYTDWAPIAITSGNNNDTYVLWRNIDGSTVIWALDPNVKIRSCSPDHFPPGARRRTVVSTLMLRWKINF